jgi:hypothetical protein
MNISLARVVSNRTSKDKVRKEYRRMKEGENACLEEEGRGREENWGGGGRGGGKSWDFLGTLRLSLRTGGGVSLTENGNNYQGQ